MSQTKVFCWKTIAVVFISVISASVPVSNLPVKEEISELSRGQEMTKEYHYLSVLPKEVRNSVLSVEIRTDDGHFNDPGEKRRYGAHCHDNGRICILYEEPLDLLWHEAAHAYIFSWSPDRRKNFLDELAKVEGGVLGTANSYRGSEENIAEYLREFHKRLHVGISIFFDDLESLPVQDLASHYRILTLMNDYGFFDPRPFDAFLASSAFRKVSR